MGISIEHLNKIKESSKTRKNGVYTRCGYAYVVINGYPKFLMGYGGIVYEYYGNFITELGTYDIYGAATVMDMKKLAKENKWI